MLTANDIVELILKLVPVPQNIFELMWTGMGWHFAHGWATFDDEIKDKEWFKKLGLFVRAMLEFFQHWWIGIAMMIYFGSIEFYPNMFHRHIPELYWLGLGIFLEDAKSHIAQSFKDGKLRKLIDKIRGN